MRHTARLTLVALMLMGAALACNLGSGGDGSPPSSTPTRTPTLFSIPTATALPTVTPNPSITPPPTQPNCTPYTNWPVYTVAAGDTLGQIAQRSGTTVDQLVTANCLADAGLIYAGQALYVPVQPATLTPAPTLTPVATANPNMPIFGKALTADQHWIDSTGRAVTYYQAVRVTVGVVQNAIKVDFYVIDPTGGSAIYIGTDSDPWDGAFVDYSFPVTGDYTFQAVAENEFMRVNSSVFTIRYDPSFNPPSGQANLLTFTPNKGFADGWTTLQAGATVTIAWPDAPIGATRVEFTFAPTGTGMTPEVIGTDLSPADGALITWAMPAGSGHIQANAITPDGATQSSQIMSVVASN